MLECAEVKAHATFRAVSPVFTCTLSVTYSGSSYPMNPLRKVGEKHRKATAASTTQIAV